MLIPLFCFVFLHSPESVIESLDEFARWGSKWMIQAGGKCPGSAHIYSLHSDYNLNPLQVDPVILCPFVTQLTTGKSYFS